MHFARGRNAISRRDPKRELSTGGVSERDHARQIERVLAGGVAKRIDTSAYVRKRSRPAAAGLMAATVFEIPGGPSFFGERGGEVRGIAGGGVLDPTSAVDY